MFDPAEWLILWSHFEAAALYGIFPVIVIALVMMGLAGVTRSWKLMQFAFFFGLLGASLGLLLGASREPAVKAFLPAVITLIGGLVIYVFPREPMAMRLLADADETPPPDLVRSFVIVALGALSLSAVGAANFGGSVRADFEAFERAETRSLMILEKVRLPLELEQLRRQLKLTVPAE